MTLKVRRHIASLCQDVPSCVSKAKLACNHADDARQEEGCLASCTVHSHRRATAQRLVAHGTTEESEPSLEVMGGGVQLTRPLHLVR